MVWNTKEFFEEKISGLRKRIKCLPYGIFYLTNNGFSIPKTFLINWRKRNFKFLMPTESGFIYEFTEICLNDCYQLQALKHRLGSIDTIVDIGANQGLFAIAARKFFPKASISCYEPNQELESVLNNNAAEINAKVYYEAVTKEDCRVNLHLRESNLHSTVRLSEVGEIKGTAFQQVVENSGGRINILKMDCEGGEWDILEDRSAFSQVDSITMEYHLWANKKSSASDLLEDIKQLGFEIIYHSKLSDSFGIITALRQSN